MVSLPEPANFIPGFTVYMYAIFGMILHAWLDFFTLQNIGGVSLKNCTSLNLVLVQLMRIQMCRASRVLTDSLFNLVQMLFQNAQQQNPSLTYHSRNASMQIPDLCGRRSTQIL